MKKKINMTIMDNWNHYKIPGQSNLHRVKRNAVFLNVGSTVNHEMAKCLAAYMLKKCGDVKFTQEIKIALKSLSDITESVIKDFALQATEFITEATPTSEPGRRVDLVDLKTDTRYEFETSLKVKKENCVTIYLE